MGKRLASVQARARTTLLLGYVFGSIACSGTTASTANPDAPTSELRARRGIFRERVFLTGVLEATRGARITPPQTPTWQVQIRWMEEDGASVTAGQKVVELDNSVFATDLETKRLEARKEEKELEQQKAQADAKAAELGFTVSQRRVELQKAELTADVPKELVPLREYQENQLAIQRARSALTAAEQELTTHYQTTEQELAIRLIQLNTTRYAIRVAERAISELVLEATRDGVLILGDVRRENRKLQVGDTVWPGYVVARIPDLTEMHVEAQLSDVDDGRVHVGEQASVRLDSYPELTFPGVVRDITPVAQETSSRSLRRAFRVRVALDTTDEEKMRPGMAAQVEILPGGNTAEVLLIPRAALDLTSSPPAALLDNGARAPVELGPCNSFECVCTGGLDDGARLRSIAGSTAGSEAGSRVGS